MGKRRGKAAMVAELKAAEERVKALRLQLGWLSGRSLGFVGFRGDDLCGVAVRESGGWWQVQEVTPLGEVLFVGAKRTVGAARGWLKEQVGADRVVRMRKMGSGQ